MANVEHIEIVLKNDENLKPLIKLISDPIIGFHKENKAAALMTIRLDAAVSTIPKILLLER